VVAARIERLRNNGQDAFGEYQVPVAVLMLKQGLGRLIRTATDRGILAVLDSRLMRKAYGRRFLESLPPARLVHDLEEVERFMAPGVAAVAPAPGSRGPNGASQGASRPRRRSPDSR
jgi:ATP-dependent DNA helicase DinG